MPDPDIQYTWRVERVTGSRFECLGDRLGHELSVAGCNPVVMVAIRGDRAAKYLMVVPQFGI